MFDRIGIFFSYPREMKLGLAKILVCAPLIEVSLHLIGLQKTRGFLSRFIVETPAGPDETTTVKRYSNAIFLFQKKLPFLSKCLARALTLEFLLGRRGIKTEVHLGVKKDIGGLKGHAWVEYSGQILRLDDEIIGDYEFTASPGQVLQEKGL